MELNKDVPSNMHYCLYCIARGQNRKKSDSLIFFFLLENLNYCLYYIVCCQRIYCLQSLLSRKKRKNVTLLDLDQIIAVAPRTFRRRWNVPNFIIHYRLFFQCIILFSLLYSFPHFLSIFCSYIPNLPPIQLFAKLKK